MSMPPVPGRDVSAMSASRGCRRRSPASEQSRARAHGGSEHHSDTRKIASAHPRCRFPTAHFHGIRATPIVRPVGAVCESRHGSLLHNAPPQRRGTSVSQWDLRRPLRTPVTFRTLPRPIGFGSHAVEGDRLAGAGYHAGLAVNDEREDAPVIDCCAAA